jgi:hypothetical protein
MYKTKIIGMERLEIFMWMSTMGIEKKVEDRSDRKPIWIARRMYDILSIGVRVCINDDGRYYSRNGECNAYNVWCPFMRKYIDHTLCDAHQYELKIQREVIE